MGRAPAPHGAPRSDVAIGAVPLPGSPLPYRARAGRPAVGCAATPTHEFHTMIDTSQDFSARSSLERHCVGLDARLVRCGRIGRRNTPSRARREEGSREHRMHVRGGCDIRCVDGIVRNRIRITKRDTTVDLDGMRTHRDHTETQHEKHSRDPCRAVRCAR
jgi:hypothetical protein